MPRYAWNKGLKGFRKGENAGANNGMWKGDKVGYIQLHCWVKNHLIEPQTCRDCNKPKKLDLANISGNYRRELSDWEWLCRRCHMLKDGRLENLKKTQFIKGQGNWKSRKRDNNGKFISPYDYKQKTIFPKKLSNRKGI